MNSALTAGDDIKIHPHMATRQGTGRTGQQNAAYLDGMPAVPHHPQRTFPWRNRQGAARDGGSNPMHAEA